MSRNGLRFLDQIRVLESKINRGGTAELKDGCGLASRFSDLVDEAVRARAGILEVGCSLQVRKAWLK